METKARISNISRDFTSGKVLMTFELDHYESEEVDRLMSRELRLKAVIWRENKTLTQNGYYWKLVELIAQELGSTKEEIHENMIQSYSPMMRDKDGVPITVKQPKFQSPECLEGHWKFAHESKDGESNILVRLKGVRNYDTKEMSVLLDHTVQEAKELGIETLPPKEIERIKNLEVNYTK